MKEFKLSFEEYLQAQKLHLGKTRRFVLPTVSAFFGGIIGLTLLLIASSVNEALKVNVTFLIPIFAFIIIFIQFIISYRQKKIAKKIYDSQRTLRENMKIIFNKEYIRWESDSSSYKVTWKDIYKYKFDKNIILIYGGENAIMVIPARTFKNDSEKQSFLEFLKG